MRGVWWTFSSMRRRRLASWLALALLVALVGGTVLAGVAAARRTSSSFPDFSRRYGGDVAIFASGAMPARTTDFPGLQTVFEESAYVNGNVVAGSTFVPAADIGLFTIPPDPTAHAFHLVAGRLPRSADEVLVGFSLEQQAHLHLGSVLRAPLFLASQAAAAFSGSGAAPGGPTVTLHVVGISASIFDFPTNQPSYSVMVGSAFVRGPGRGLLTGSLGVFRLRGGQAAIPRFAYYVTHLPGGAGAYAYPLNSLSSAVESSIHPQVLGWWLFALIAAAAGIALVGQALSRQAVVERAANPTLAALGVRPVQLFWLSMLRAGVIGVAGALGAIALAAVLSPLTPVGEARAAEPSLGFVVSPLVLGLGGLAIVAGTLVLGVVPAWRASRARAVAAADSDTGLRRASVVAAAAARGGAPPSMVIGIRHALERGRGRGSVPVATALVGTVAAVAALAGTAVFGASLTTLLATPHLYGQNWNLGIQGIDGPHAAAIGASLAKQPSVEALTMGISNKPIDVNGVETNVILFKVLKGTSIFGVAEGHDPTGPGQIALGSQTLANAHAHVGSMVRVTLIGPTGVAYTASMRAVGELVVPPSLAAGDLGDGSVMPISAAVALVCGDPGRPACVSGLDAKLDSPGATSWGMGVRVAPTAQGRALIASVQRRLSANLAVLAPPTDLVNFGEAVSFPLLLGLTLGIFGTATLLHLLLVSVARRRREHALLKVLGFVRHQIRAAVCWQGLTIAVVGIAAGVPLGLGLGRLAWDAFATNVGALPQPSVPVAQLAIESAAVVAVAVLLSALPGALASRLRPGLALRGE